MKGRRSAQSVKRYSGTQNPDEWLRAKAVEFIRTMETANDQYDKLTGRNPNVILLPKGGKWNPTRSKDGAGALWLKLFREYQGDACLIFPFRTAYDPYGHVTFNYQKMRANRAMCLMVHKLPPEGKDWALHSCGNGHLGCVNPNHLYWGDRSDNAKDAHRHSAEGKQQVA